MAAVKSKPEPAPETGPETHAQRCKRELEEQAVILAKVREDSDRYDREIARSSGSTDKEEVE